MSLYERFRLEPIRKTDMPDLPMKTRQPALDKPVPPKRLSQKSRGLMSNPVPPARRTSTARTAKPAKKTSASTAKAKSPLARGKGQPRDERGRWVKVGAAIWSGTKATVKGVGKAVKGTARAVKRVQTSARKNAALRHRERNIALAKEEHKLGLRKRRVVRRRKR